MQVFYLGVDANLRSEFLDFHTKCKATRENIRKEHVSYITNAILEEIVEKMGFPRDYPGVSVKERFHDGSFYYMKFTVPTTNLPKATAVAGLVKKLTAAHIQIVQFKVRFEKCSPEPIPF